MTDFAKDFESDVQKDEDARKRQAVLIKLQGYGTATLEDLFNVCQNTALGSVMKTLTLADLWSIGPTPEVEEVEDGDDQVQATPRRRKKAAKKAPKKAKKAPKKAKKAPKAAANGRKPRQDYGLLCKEVVAYMKKAKEPQSTGDLQKKFGISGSQARRVFQLLVGEKQVKQIGKGGRGSKFELR